jgi:hypothetical protein
MKWWQGWAIALGLPLVALATMPVAWPAWVRMWSLAVATYAGMKWLSWRGTVAPEVPAWRHAAYLVTWPGMDAPAFLSSRRLSQAPTAGEWAFAWAKLALGLAMVFGLARFMPAEDPLVTGWVGMAGIVFVLHFGSFHVLSCCWRSRGVIAQPLMDWPIAARSVSEFWGRRWNLAFRDLTHRFLFRPLAARLGPRLSLAVGFLFSGLVHDLVISVPARGGYGGPTVFFLVQGGAILLERSSWGRHLGLEAGWRGWLFTAAVLLAPAWLLFHPPFILEVVLPFLRAIKAIP